MAYQLPADLEALVRQQVIDGPYVSEDEVIRDALRALAEERGDLSAVQDAIDEWRAGDNGVPLDEAFDAIRKKHSISPDA